ncbi:MAG: hypothetical protein ABH833_01185 [Parcubacteria group bacterium]
MLLLELMSRYKQILQSLGVIIIGIVLVLGFVALVEAGTLQPPSAPSESSDPTDLTNIYDVLTTDFDSSSIASNSDGSAIGIARCILEKMRGNNDGC